MQRQGLMEDTDLYADEEEYENEEQVAPCPSCNDMTPFDTLNEKKKGKGFDLLLKCKNCEHVYTFHLRPPKQKDIPFMLTDAEMTNRVVLQIEEDELLEIDDHFEDSGMVWRISRIEIENERSVKKALAGDVSRCIALRADEVMVRITKTRGEWSESTSLRCPPDEYFKGGSKMYFEGEEWRIRAIHTGAGRTMKGNVKAIDIKRIYLHEPIVEEKLPVPKTERERRQAWKEGRLGYNPNPIKPNQKPEQKQVQGRPRIRKKKRY